MDLDGVCFNFSQAFMSWVYREHYDDVKYLQSFIPSRYDFWALWRDPNLDKEWFITRYGQFAAARGFYNNNHTLHGTGLTYWRLANQWGIPVAIVTARGTEFDQLDKDIHDQTTGWLYDEGLHHELILVTDPHDCKLEQLSNHLPYKDNSILTVEDSLSNAQRYHDAGLTSVLVDRPWNQTTDPDHTFNTLSPLRQRDSDFVHQQTQVVHLP